MDNEKKSRILYVKRFLEEQTDEAHQATLKDILAYLNGEGIAASHRTVAQDIELLLEAGVDVVCNRSTQNRYFVGAGRFELPELKLLIDAVQASHFIPHKKSVALIEKLSALTSVHQAEELRRFLYTDKQIKPLNERVYVTMDLLHAAIRQEKQVRFKYYEYTPKQRKAYKYGGRVYEFSPYGLIWNNDRYYVAGYSRHHGKVITFRVDRIAAPKLTDIPAEPKPEGFDIAKYANTTIQMYDGPLREVALLCENSQMNAIIDYFGEVKSSVTDKEHFTARVSVAVSPTFFGWILSFGGKIRIAAPQDVLCEFRACLEFGLINTDK